MINIFDKIFSMPLTSSGKKVLSSMKKQYGSGKGSSVFYASINKGKKGSGQWHEKNMRQMVMKHRAK